MSTQWEAANPTEANGVRQEMTDDVDRKIKASNIDPKPVTIEDIEEEMQAVLDGTALPGYALMHASTADELRNYLEKFQEGRKKNPRRFEIASEGGGFAALTASVSAVVPNPSGPVLNLIAAVYHNKMLKQVVETVKDRKAQDHTK